MSFLYKDFSTQLARECGEIIRKNFSLGMARSFKDDDTPVTETDLEINRIVVEKINTTYPTHDILAEEQSDTTRHSSLIWLCDPLDGTIPFTFGIPTCVFSLALVDDGVPIAGTVYDPFLDRMFYAEKGAGAFLNDQPTQISSQASLKGSVIAISGTNPSFKSGVLYDILRENKLRNVLNVGSGTYPSALVAAGELPGVILGSTNPYDAASLKILIEEAGGTVTDVNGNEQRYDQKINGCVLSNGIIHKELLGYVRDAQQALNSHY